MSYKEPYNNGEWDKWTDPAPVVGMVFLGVFVGSEMAEDWEITEVVEEEEGEMLVYYFKHKVLKRYSYRKGVTK